MNRLTYAMVFSITKPLSVLSITEFIKPHIIRVLTGGCELNAACGKDSRNISATLLLPIKRTRLNPFLHEHSDQL